MKSFEEELNWKYNQILEQIEEVKMEIRRFRKEVSDVRERVPATRICACREGSMNVSALPIQGRYAL